MHFDEVKALLSPQALLDSLTDQFQIRSEPHFLKDVRHDRREHQHHRLQPFLAHRARGGPKTRNARAGRKGEARR